MTRELVTISPQASIIEAATLMAAKHIRRLLVVVMDPQGQRLDGIVSESDLRRAFPLHINPFGLMPEAYKTHATVADIMKQHPVTITPDAPIEEAARLMSDRKVGALPVLSGVTLVGLITESDIFHAFVSMFQSSSGGVRVTFDLTKNEDTLDLMCKLARARHVRVHSLITAMEHDRPVCAVRLTGTDVEALIEDLWKSGHHVLSVLRLS